MLESDRSGSEFPETEAGEPSAGSNGDSRTPWNALLQQARAGSTANVGQLLEQYRAYLTIIVRNELEDRLRVKVAPSDLVQDSLLEAFHNFERFNGASEAELLRWLRRILLNNLSDARKRFRHTAGRALDRECSLHEDSNQITAFHDLPAESPLPLDKVIRAEQQQSLLQAVRALPERQRRAVVLRNLESKSFADIGAALEISSDAARKLWERAIHRLAEVLRSNGKSSLP